MRNLIVAIQKLGNVGGQEKSTLEVLTRLARKGWKIELFSFHLSDWPLDLPLTWHHVPKLPIKLQLLQNLWFAYYTRGVFWYLHFKNQKTPILTIGTAAHIADIRILQFVHCAVLPRLTSRKSYYPNARTLIHRVYQALFARVEATWERKLLHHSRALVAISKSVAQDVETYLPKAAKVPLKVVHHAVDTCENVTKCADSMCRILFVGALERKGIEKALKSLVEVRELNWFFTAVGGGDIAKWQKLAEELGLAAKVDFVGSRPATAFFKTADLFLFPSTYEPFGLVITEAASHGLCLLASKECGAMELWQSMPAWLNLSCDDEPVLWANCLRILIETPKLRQELAIAAQADFFRWTWDDVASAYESTIDEVSRAISA